MQKYLNKITLTKNFRGVYDLDTSKGCLSGTKINISGCYNECYAARYSKRYGFDFTKTVFRYFENVKHVDYIRKKIYESDMPFIRIGVNGDPSENWRHVLSTINLVYGIKPIVIITKHWNKLTSSQLKELCKFDLCINTSVSALDSTDLIKHRLEQYEVLKNYSNSVLRIISCDFNKNNLTGLILNDMQDYLFNNENVIDNVLRISKNNIMLLQGIIKAKKYKFLKSQTLFSKKNIKTYTGYCNNCPEMCGIYLNKKCK